MAVVLMCSAESVQGQWGCGFRHRSCCHQVRWCPQVRCCPQVHHHSCCHSGCHSHRHHGHCCGHGHAVHHGCGCYGSYQVPGQPMMGQPTRPAIGQAMPPWIPTTQQDCQQMYSACTATCEECTGAQKTECLAYCDCQLAVCNGTGTGPCNLPACGGIIMGGPGN